MCDWPEGVSVRHSSFRLTPPVPLQSLVPEMDPQAKDLMEVSDFYLAGGLSEFRRGGPGDSHVLTLSLLRLPHLYSKNDQRKCQIWNP